MRMGKYRGWKIRVRGESGRVKEEGGRGRMRDQW